MQISDKGGEGPEWAPDGKTLYYSFSGLIRRVRVNPEAGEIGEPEVLRHIPPALGWTMAPDGRFLVARVAPNAERHSVKILLNWRSVLGSGK